jgi:hypothetical protein
MRSWAIILLFGSLILPGIALAEEGAVCFPNAEARAMVVTLEQAPLLQARIDAAKEENTARQRENELLKENNALLKEQIGQYKELLQLQRDSYEGIIKAQKPNPVKEFLDKLGFVGIGALVALGLML